MVCGITQLSQVHRHFLHSPVQLPGRLALRHKIRRIIRQAFQAENALFHLFQQRCCHILYIRGGSVHKIILQGIHSALQQAEIRKKAAFQPPAQLQFIRCIFLLRVQGIGQRRSWCVRAITASSSSLTVRRSCGLLPLRSHSIW